MAKFYTKTLKCGCIIIAVTCNTDTFIGGHTYKHICDKCVLFSEETIDDKLQNIYMTDNRVFKNNNNGWIQLSYV
jgi:hypothetical protein